LRRLVAAFEGEIGFDCRLVEPLDVGTGHLAAIRHHLTTDMHWESESFGDRSDILALLREHFDAPKQTQVTDDHAKHEERGLPLLQELL
jgi:hypothetical protein